MRHSLVDKHSDLDSRIHRLDPRTRVLTVLAFVLAVVATPSHAHWPAFVLYFILIAGLILLAHVPPLYVLKRSSTIVPFVLMITAFLPFLGRGEVVASYSFSRWRVSVTYDGLTLLWSTLARAWLSTLGVILLSATTPLPRLLRGLGRLGLPRVMVMILSFMYRYAFVLIDEVMRMQRARDSRCVSTWHPLSRRWSRQIRAAGAIVGTLFLRSYERGERVYMAMLARGFDGEIRMLNDLRFNSWDACFASGFFLCLSLIVVLSLRGVS